MESQGGRKRDANELQGAALQDQALRPFPASDVTGYPFDGADGPLEDMLVIHLTDRILRCFARRSQWTTQTGESPLRSLMVREQGHQVAAPLPLDEAKAIFFVHSFDGRSTHEELRFHDEMAPPGRIWVRLMFRDGEMMEGLVENDKVFVLSESFFMSPVDPDSNNWLVHVFKSKLMDLQVLALRAAITPNGRG